MLPASGIRAWIVSKVTEMLQKPSARREDFMGSETTAKGASSRGTGRGLLRCQRSRLENNARLPARYPHRPEDFPTEMSVS